VLMERPDAQRSRRALVRAARVAELYGGKGVLVEREITPQSGSAYANEARKGSAVVAWLCLH
jgi:hypothetical protein